MAFIKIENPALAVLRSFQAVFGLLVLGLSAYIVHWYKFDAMSVSPTELNFLLFVSGWSLLSTIYLDVVSRLVPRASHPYSALGVAASNVVFWFAGFVALAVFLGRFPSCRGMVCTAARADNVFAAFNFALWAVTEAFFVRDFFYAGPRNPSPVVAKELASSEP